MKKYVLYTSNKSSVDAQFNAISGSDQYQESGLFKDFESRESGNHRVTVFSAFDDCFTQFCDSLTDVEFFGSGS